MQLHQAVAGALCNDMSSFTFHLDSRAGHDSPGIAQRGSCPSPANRKSLLGPPQHLKCSNALYHFHIDAPGSAWGAPNLEGPAIVWLLHAARGLDTLFCLLRLTYPLLPTRTAQGKQKAVRYSGKRADTFSKPVSDSAR